VRLSSIGMDLGIRSWYTGRHFSTRFADDGSNGGSKEDRSCHDSCIDVHEMAKTMMPANAKL
jgi:hypothetical protein